MQVASFCCLQADTVLKSKLGPGAQARGGHGAKPGFLESFARYLSFVHFAVFCLLSLLKAVVRLQGMILTGPMLYHHLLPCCVLFVRAHFHVSALLPILPDVNLHVYQAIVS